MENLGYYNGKFGPLDEMTVPMNDRVHWFGDGVYDAGPARNYKIFAIDEHIDRFFNSAKLLEIEMPCTKQELKDLLNKLVKEVDTGDLFVYYQVTRGTGIRDHAFTKGPGNLWVMLKPASISDGLTPIKLITEPDTRFFHCNIKTLNLLPSVAAVQVSADGQPIVMLADHQTTGGYAKIATVISADLPALAQLRPGQRACFTFVTPSRAVQAARQQAALWQRVRDRL